jgi:hypothetical protein
MTHETNPAQVESQDTALVNMRFFGEFRPTLYRGDYWIQETSAQVWRGKPGQKYRGIATLTSQSKTTPLKVTYLEAFEYNPQDPSSTLVHPIKTNIADDPWEIEGVRLVHDQSKQDISLRDIKDELMKTVLSQVDYAYLLEVLIQRHSQDQDVRQTV